MPSTERCPECGAPLFSMVNSDDIPGWRCSSCEFAALDGAAAALRNRTYRARDVRLLVDGNQVCAMIGPDLVQGVGGFGSSVHEALKDLADQLVKNGIWIEVAEQ